MPRYFFDVHDGDLIADPGGIELPDLDAARAKAAAIAADLARDVPKDLWKDHPWKVSVRDVSGAVLLERPVITESAVVLALRQGRRRV